MVVDTKLSQIAMYKCSHSPGPFYTLLHDHWSVPGWGMETEKVSVRSQNSGHTRVEHEKPQSILINITTTNLVLLCLNSKIEEY